MRFSTQVPNPKPSEMHAPLYLTPKIFNSSFIFTIRWCFGIRFSLSGLLITRNIFYKCYHLFYFFFLHQTMYMVHHHTVIPFDISSFRVIIRNWRSLKGKSFKFQTMFAQSDLFMPCFSNCESNSVQVHELFIEAIPENLDIQSNGSDDCEIMKINN